jgi:hypothetical protein
MVWIRRKLKQYVYCNLQVDPEEECRILAREKAATVANFENTIKAPIFGPEETRHYEQEGTGGGAEEVSAAALGS